MANDIPFFDDDAPRPSGIAARALAARAASTAYLDGLNPEQRRAVETTEGPVLVLAGAGTGKTRVLTTRIAHILSTGRAWPSQILAVTFTNKAAREMRERIAALVGAAVEGMPWLGTFHSIGVKLLRRHAELVGLKSDFSILDPDDQIRLMRQVIEAENLDEKRWPARQLALLIDGWKNKGLYPETIPEGDSRGFAGKGRVLYAAYQARLKTLNATDFGDLLLLPIRLFREHDDVLADYQRRFRYILVDEYQDTNTAQYLWLRLIAQRARTSPTSPLRGGREGARSAPEAGGGNAATPTPTLRVDPPLKGEGEGRPSPWGRGWAGERGGAGEAGADAHAETKEGGGYSAQPNICCVGDDDQSIYGWRGAEVDNILRFDKDFPGAAIIRLERNYRSTSHILAAASHLIAHNEGRLGKTLFTDAEDPDDPRVKVHASWDSEEEARSVGDEIEALQRKDHRLDDMAILVRASFQMREFEERFVTLGLPYRVIGGPRFYERAEIRDAMAYLRVVAQPADDLAFERIVNVPKRGLGDAAIRQLHDAARIGQIPMLAAAAELAESDEMKPKPRAALREVVANFARWREALERTPHVELAETILEESGYTAMWKADRAADAPGRLDNLKELVRALGEYESLRAFLEHVALVMDAGNETGEDKVSIMTLHSAKGLEFETVFLPGWEEGLFPHQRALDEGGRSGLEEERRLAYVGLTRAKLNLHIWFASNRRIHGLWQSTIPSRFVDELPEGHVEVVEAGGNYGGYGRANPYGASRFDQSADAFRGSYSSPGWARAQANRSEATTKNWGTRSGHAVERIGYGETDSGYGAGRGSVKGRTIDGELVAKSVSTEPSRFAVGDRVFHQKFGPGDVTSIEGNKLTISFDRAGEKRVLEGFVERV
ncbi:MAG: UvrD-helicase domain-containing protein [Phyllobacteriaceae bacterium]|nr:UvrD-helicase domain-containing protein [Phyllobacteriaceae bacterium]